MTRPTDTHDRAADDARTIAHQIAQFTPPHRALEEADRRAVDRDQDWEHESTTFEFEDGSRLRISGCDIEVVDDCVGGAQ